MNDIQRHNVRKRFIDLAMNKRAHQEERTKFKIKAMLITNKLTTSKPKISVKSISLATNDERLAKPIYESLIDQGKE